MFSPKKMAACLMVACLLSFMTVNIAYAADVMGYVDLQKIVFQHPKFAQVQKQIKDIMAKKQQEAKTAIDKENDDKKKAQIFQTKRQEAANEERKLMEPLMKDVNIAIRKVANAKKITVVVDKGAVFYGGTEITQDVITEIKKN